MDDPLLILVRYLTGLVSDTLAARVLTLVPIILALITLLRRIAWVEARKRWTAPGIAAVLGLTGGIWVAWPGWWPQGVLAGCLAALTAVGAHSAAKNVLQRR